MKKVLIFDVNETLLDLSALDHDFERLFGSSRVRKEWFSQFIQSALVTIVTDSYQPFGSIGSAAFDMIAERHNVSISADDKAAALTKIAKAPPHAEACQAQTTGFHNGDSDQLNAGSGRKTAQKRRAGRVF